MICSYQEPMPKMLELTTAWAGNNTRRNSLSLVSCVWTKFRLTRKWSRNPSHITHHVTQSLILIYIFINELNSYLFTQSTNNIRVSTFVIHCFTSSGASFQLFLGGQIFFKFLNATGLMKNWKKQHFICGNLTLFIVPSFLSFFFFFFFSFFLSFFFFLFPWGATAPLK